MLNVRDEANIEDYVVHDLAETEGARHRGWPAKKYDVPIASLKVEVCDEVPDT